VLLLATLTDDSLAVGVPLSMLLLSWMTYVTKMLWDIRQDTSVRAAQQEAFNAEVREDIAELQRLLPRHIPQPTLPFK